MCLIVPAVLASLATVILCRADASVAWWDTGHPGQELAPNELRGLLKREKAVG